VLSKKSVLGKGLITSLLTGLSAFLLMISCNKANPTANNDLPVDGVCLLTITAIEGSIIKSPDKDLYDSGDVVTLTAIPDNRCCFVNWSGDTSAKNSTITVTMTGNRNITANFRTDGQKGTMTDIDGNAYTTISIGNQEWTVENLRVTKFNNGVPIPKVVDDAAWTSLTTPGFCYHTSTANADSVHKFGALYNWYAVSTGKLAPAGWHVPNEEEWKFLVNYLVANNYNWDGAIWENKVAKSLAATTDWIITQGTTAGSGSIGNDLTRNNRSGFSALPGGYRSGPGKYTNVGLYGYWWSATERDANSARLRYLDCNDTQLSMNTDNKNCGFSVRLVRDR
jgi:uncharacterized protein (TIGR02145 family)